jgi:hemolysin activation/secretion protein
LLLVPGSVAPLARAQGDWMTGGTPPGLSVAASLPGFAQLEAQGARIGEIRIRHLNIFDTDNPAENKALFRLANTLHFRTREGVIAAALLFRTGERVSVSRIEETERVLRTTRYLYDVRIRPIALRDGVVDVEVQTRDAWTLDLGLNAGRSGGANSGSVALTEYNLLGTGITLGVGRYADVDRSGNEFMVSADRILGTWASFGYGMARNSDGERQALRLVRPFYSLDARWAAGLSVSRDDRIDPVYRAGEVVAEYRRRENRGEVFGGWSAGLIDGWVRRISAGLAMREDAHAFEPGRTPPPRLPSDATLAGPFLRYELLQDRFEKTTNLNQIGRSEFLPLGLAASAQIGWSTSVFGATRDAWLYQTTMSRGFEPFQRHRLLASASLSGQLADSRLERQRLGLQARYYAPHGHRRLFYAAVSADALHRPAPLDVLLLGGDNGLRGYPLRYASGERRVLITLEERFYTDQYWFELFRVGAAAFLDVGRAWGGDPYTVSDPGWLANAGVGLRVFNVRSAFSNVVHIDLAVPLRPPEGISRAQLLVRTRASF